MKKSEIQKIIVKFINQEANSSELESLNSWLKKENNQLFFSQFVKIEYLTALNMGNYNVDKAKITINEKLKNSKRKQRSTFFKRVSIVASVVTLLGFSVFHYINFNRANNSVQDRTAISDIDVGSSKAILTLNNGEEVSLGKDKNYTSDKVKSNGEKLLYHQDDKLRNELSYNYLTVPRGGEFFVQLADGTKVWLNSDSKLKYPERFNSGEPREVELVYGEAYFEVSPSTKHDGDAFNVITKNQEVNVLGTHFNIKAYNEDNKIATTLVEGRVNVKNGEVIKLLKPNQQSLINANSNAIEVIEVDVMREIAWVKGMFSFNEESLEEMMKVLSRWYNVDVIFESTKSKNYQFTGVLERTRTIQDFLGLIEATSEGEVHFEITEKKVIIK
ncbi:FecR family protein [Snuella sedimenti]|uniref:DUF4974 domain-containing protein n=1 Tax=Snuella sedimenti TaxID=2798802 RepID=A0A8J7IGZ2_9FLAO|nr:FecR family protein [Snuella sedimenti]MBJ6368073.1 DUF4974 domain-containing protein [Snuella sedimenti]